ncbi:amidohydrolase [Gulosibacter massiliensis]|uniref:amidohydrolase n=1 Tax=Gulosibacter massiliensis TaxID=2479839 RepID=UPI001F495A81|nr:amidohydrolase [Gulosibacter massiliensis]
MKIDLILENASIITMDPTRPTANRVGVWNGQIVGLDEELEGLSASAYVDLGGSTLIPGIIDAHCHTTWFGRTLVEADMLAPETFDEALAVLEARAAETPAGEWILAAGYNQHRFGGRYPTIEQLDAIADGRPLVIRQSSGHAAIANTVAMQMAGILESPDPIGGAIERDPSGKATGRLEETAQDLVLNLLKPYRRTDVIDAIDRATKVYASEGITSFSEAGIAAGWIGHSPIEMRAYQDAAESGQLHARAQLLPTIDALSPITGAPGDPSGSGLDLGIRSGHGSDFVSLGPTKVFVDGSLTGRTCALTEPFCGEPNNVGMLQYEEDDLRQRILAAAEAGWAVAAHAIGDRAIDIAIDVLAEAQRRFGRPPMPHRIEHVSYLRDDQVPRLAEAGIAVTPQAMFVRHFGDAFRESLGDRRARGVYRARSLVDAGVLVAGSSDRPCIDGNPFEAMRTLMDRTTLTGAVFSAHERVTAQTALAMYTREAARATGRSSEVGMIRPGLAADFAVLDRSPITNDPEQLSTIRVLATLVAGNPTHGTL